MEVDLEATLQEICATRASLVPVGAIDAATFHKFAAVVRQHTSLDLLDMTHGTPRMVRDYRLLA